jgi:hypothetical protein
VTAFPSCAMRMRDLNLHDEDRRRLGSTFRVHLDPDREPSNYGRRVAGREIFVAAFTSADISADVVAVSAVRGGDAHQLP